MQRRAGVFLSLALLAILVSVNACTDSQITSPDPRGNQEVSEYSHPGMIKEAKREPGVKALLPEINEAMAAQGLNMGIFKAEVLTLNGELMESGQTLFASDHYLWLGARWVPGDQRRNADGDNLTYLVDQSAGAANPDLTNADTEPAIDRGFESWQEDNPCAKVNLIKRADSGADATIVDAFLQMGDLGNPFLADIVNAGFWPAAFFDALVEDGSTFILGVTFTIVFRDENQNPTDIDHDGFADVATREVYYNNAFPWAVSGSGGVDVESVAVHENGHGLGLGHFGRLFITNANGGLHASPRAVMNAAYTGVFRTPLRTDRAAYCGTYASWAEPR